MKYLNQFLILSILFSAIIPSCSIEKRRYLPGYHIESRILKRHSLNQKLTINKENEKALKHEITLIDSNSTIKTLITIDNIIANDNAIASTEKDQFLTPKDNLILPSIYKRKVTKNIEMYKVKSVSREERDWKNRYPWKIIMPILMIALGVLLFILHFALKSATEYPN